MSFSVGNQEIANLLVQNEVDRIEARLAALTAEMRQLSDERIAPTERIDARIKVAAEQDEHLVTAVNLWNSTQATQRRLNVEVHSVQWVYNSSYVRHVHPGSAKTIAVPGQIVMTDEAGYAYCGEVNICGVQLYHTYVFTDEDRKDWAEFEALDARVTTLGTEMRDLHKQLAEREHIEKRVLAHLTKQTLTEDPDALSALRALAASVSQPLRLAVDAE